MKTNVVGVDINKRVPVVFRLDESDPSYRVITSISSPSSDQVLNRSKKK